jgi:hypothetical protein
MMVLEMAPAWPPPTTTVVITAANTAVLLLVGSAAYTLTALRGQLSDALLYADDGDGVDDLLLQLGVIGLSAGELSLDGGSSMLVLCDGCVFMCVCVL